MKIEKLIGKTLISVVVNEANDEILFTDTQGVEYKMYHDQDCCESVAIDDIVGDLTDLIGNPITMAEEASNSDNPKLSYEYPDEDAECGMYRSYDDSCTWTFYKLATVKGYVNIKWYGSSNGYYSESVSFVQLGTEDEYGYYPHEI